MKTLRVLITGHNGFIGRNMTEWCRAEDWDVSGWEWDPDQENWPDISDYDWVIHLGAIASINETDVEKILKQNLDFSQWLFTQCNRYGVHLQYASSSSVYGKTKDFSEFAPCYPDNPYAWSKYLFDRWVFYQEQHVYVQGFRYFNVYGKYMNLRGPRANVIHKWQEQARKEGIIEIYEGAERNKRDFTWVGDVCRLHIDFIKTMKGSGIWNCGSGLAHPYLDIAEEIAEQEGAVIKYIPIPNPEAFRSYTCADLTHLKETVGRRKWLNVFEWLAQDR